MKDNSYNDLSGSLKVIYESYVSTLRALSRLDGSDTILLTDLSEWRRVGFWHAEQNNVRKLA